MAIPDHLSYSAIDLFSKCPLKFYSRYILGEREEPNKAMTLGSIFHKLMEINFKHKLAHKVDLSNKSLEINFNEVFPELMHRDGHDIAFDPELQLKAWQLISQYHREMAPSIEPKYIEKKLEIPLPGKKIKTLLGFVDLITQDDLVIDYKATAWPWSNDQVAQSLQPTTYGLLLGVDKLSFEYHLIIKSDAIRHSKFGDGIVVKHTSRRKKDFEWLSEYINKIIFILEQPDPLKFIVPSPGQQCLDCFCRKSCGYRTR